MKKAKKIITIFAICLLFIMLTAVILFQIDTVSKKILQPYISDMLGIESQSSEWSFDLFTGKILMENVKLGEKTRNKESYELSGKINKVIVDLDMMKLLTGNIFIEQILIDELTGDYLMKEGFKTETGKDKMLNINIADINIKKSKIKINFDIEGQKIPPLILNIDMQSGNYNNDLPFSIFLQNDFWVSDISLKDFGKIRIENNDKRILKLKGTINIDSKYLHFAKEGKLDFLIGIYKIEDKIEYDINLKPVGVVLFDKDLNAETSGLTSLSPATFLKTLIKKGGMNIKFKMNYSDYKNKSFQETFNLIYQRIAIELFKEFAL